TLDPCVEVGDQRDGGVAQGQLAGEYRFRMTGHVDDRAADRGVPVGLRPGREPRPLDHHHRAAVGNVEALRRGGLHHRLAADRTVRVGEVHMYGAGVVERLYPAARTVDELVGYQKSTWTQLRPQAADGARRDHLARAQGTQGPHVGTVRNLVRREAVVTAVAGEGSPPPARPPPPPGPSGPPAPPGGARELPRGPPGGREGPGPRPRHRP